MFSLETSAHDMLARADLQLEYWDPSTVAMALLQVPSSWQQPPTYAVTH
jgi:hypothetical protein